MNNIFSKNKTANNKNGFVILFAVLISSVVLLIAVGISNIASNEVTLSSSARESQNAFFAADTGAECALYWDIKQGYFPADIANRPSGMIASCGASAKLSDSGGADINGRYSYTFDLDLNKQCAKVLVDKGYDPLGTNTYMTKVESRGSNVPCGSTSPKAIERAVRLTY